MARSWQELFITGQQPSNSAGEVKDEPLEKKGFFKRLRSNMRKTREALTAEVRSTLFDQIDDQTFERLEELLVMADLGAATTAQVVSVLEDEVNGGSLEGGEAITNRLIQLLAEVATTENDRIDIRPEPTVIMTVGVNGTGKTTTAGKLAWYLQKEFGRKVVLAAADTFRAAAVEQLELWAQRAECDFVRGPDEGDPGSVAYEAIRQARENGSDIVIIDTAGRLHTADNLMAELAKVCRVIAKQIPDAPHETLLTIDATTGQNGMRQAKIFSQAVDVNGIVLTKLDGTAKGGIALAIANELDIPVKLIGTGETLEDLRPFDATAFAKALLE